MSEILDDDFQAQQQQDEQELQERVLEALAASLKRPLTTDEAMLLGWATGLATEFYRTTHTT